MSIPRLPERVSCMIYRRKLDFDIAELRPDLDFLRSAALELRRSTKFKQLLQVGCLKFESPPLSFVGSPRGR